MRSQIIFPAPDPRVPHVKHATTTLLVIYSLFIDLSCSVVIFKYNQRLVCFSVDISCFLILKYGCCFNKVT